MIIYLQSIENEHHKPTKIENNITVPKPRSEYTDDDKKLSMDAKVMNSLYYALSKSEFNKITS
jgi:hypothetical protein